ncbi:MAG: hypothetical protein AAF063_33125 [Cyanobacteria bacterium J06643_5]
MELTSLVATVISVLTPFVKKGAEEFVGAVGKDTYEKAKTIFGRLKQRWAGDTEASGILTYFEKKPERYQPILEKILQEKLAEDLELAEQLNKLILGIDRLKLEIVQKMEKGEKVTGLKAKTMNQGSAKVEQDIKDGKEILGADIENIG